VAPASIVFSSSESCSTPQNTAGAAYSVSTKDYQKIAFFDGSITGNLQQEHQIMPSSFSSSSLFSRHIMCKDHDIYYNPIYPTTIFKPSDAKAECLTTVTINNTIEFRWYYRSNSSKTWISCYNWSENALFGGEYYYAGFLRIAGYWPGLNYPRAYKVGVYLDDYLSFYEFFEITNGGLNSPRTCEDIDANGRPVNMKSRFTIGADTKACNYLSFDNIAYYNEELEDCHNFTTVWIQPNGSTYEEFSLRFADYKNQDITWNCWKYAYTNENYIFINSSIPVGNWRVEVYLDDYYLNGTWIPYGPISTTPFTVGSGPVADWTVMVYLDGDNSLESAAIDTFLNLASVGSSPQVKIAVQMDRIGIDDRYGNWTDCKRFYILKDITPTPENATQDLGEIDMGEPETLKDFVNWTMNNYPANRYFLVLWDHGAGFMGFCFDITNLGNSLSLPELSQALNGLPATIDVILVDACSTSMIEVAYQIKDYANLLIGPEDLGYEPAPYKDYLSDLASNSTMSPKAFAKEVVTNYINWCSSAANIQNATLSATDLTKITSVTAAIDDYALELEEKETTFHEQISLARNFTEGYQGPYEKQTGNFIDLYHFAQLAYEYVHDPELQAAAIQLMTSLSIGNAIVADANKAHPNSHGLSIFFPDENEKYNAFGDTYEKTDFTKDTLWDKFITYHMTGSVLTIHTPQPGNLVKFDDVSYATDGSGKIGLFSSPEYHTVSVASSISTGRGSRLVFVRWNDSDTSNPRTIFINGKTTLTAQYDTQYQLFISGNFGTTDPDVGEHWYNAYSAVRIWATQPIITSGERYNFLGWTGKGTGSYSGPDNSVLITMNEPINETATWNHEYYLAVASLYGSPSSSSGWLDANVSITVSVTSPALGPTGMQYVCTGWNGTGSVSTSGTTASADFTMTQTSSIAWNWKTQYLLAVRTDPTGLASPPGISPTGPWFDNGTLVRCTSQTIDGYVFDRWSVNGENWDHGVSTITFTMSHPREAVAYYTHVQPWWDILSDPRIISVLIAIIGLTVTTGTLGSTWIRNRGRRNITKFLLDQADTLYLTFKQDPKKCKEEFCKLRSTTLEMVTNGKITEQIHSIIEKRIDNYISELPKQKAPKT